MDTPSTHSSEGEVEKTSSDQLLSMLAHADEWPPETLGRVKAELQKRGVQFNTSPTRQYQQSRPPRCSHVAIGISAVALVLISLLPPVFVKYAVYHCRAEYPRVHVDQGSGFGFFTEDQTRPPRYEFDWISSYGGIWFAPILSPGRLVGSLWLSEYMIWLLLTVGLLAVSRGRRARANVAVLCLLVSGFISLFVPVQRPTIFAQKLESPSEITNRIPVEARQLLLRRSESSLSATFSTIWKKRHNLHDLGQALNTLMSPIQGETPETVPAPAGIRKVWYVFDGRGERIEALEDTLGARYDIAAWSHEPPTDAGTVNQNVVRTIEFGQIAPLVFFVWLIGIYGAAFIGLLAQRKKSDGKRR